MEIQLATLKMVCLALLLLPALATAQTDLLTVSILMFNAFNLLFLLCKFLKAVPILAHHFCLFLARAILQYPGHLHREIFFLEVT